MRIVEYDYKPEFASAMGINTAHQTGTHSLLDFMWSTIHVLIPTSSGGCMPIALDSTLSF